MTLSFCFTLYLVLFSQNYLKSSVKQYCVNSSKVSETLFYRYESYVGPRSGTALWAVERTQNHLSIGCWLPKSIWKPQCTDRSLRKSVMFSSGLIFWTWKSTELLLWLYVLYFGKVSHTLWHLYQSWQPCGLTSVMSLSHSSAYKAHTKQVNMRVLVSVYVTDT